MGGRTALLLQLHGDLERSDGRPAVTEEPERPVQPRGQRLDQGGGQGAVAVRHASVKRDRRPGSSMGSRSTSSSCAPPVEHAGAGSGRRDVEHPTAGPRVGFAAQPLRWDKGWARGRCSVDHALLLGRLRRRPPRAAHPRCVQCVVPVLARQLRHHRVPAGVADGEHRVPHEVRPPVEPEVVLDHDAEHLGQGVGRDHARQLEQTGPLGQRRSRNEAVGMLPAPSTEPIRSGWVAPSTKSSIR